MQYLQSAIRYKSTQVLVAYLHLIEMKTQKWFWPVEPTFYGIVRRKLRAKSLEMQYRVDCD